MGVAPRSVVTTVAVELLNSAAAFVDVMQDVVVASISSFRACTQFLPVVCWEGFGQFAVRVREDPIFLGTFPVAAPEN